MNSACQKVYTLIRPDDEKAVPVLIDSPHSGRHIPDQAGFILSPDAHKFYEDRDVDALIHGLEQDGMTCLSAAFSRCYIDPNRAENDIEEEIYDGSCKDSGTIPLFEPSAKAKAGFGLIRRLDKHGHMLQMPVTIAEIQHRLDRFYAPYHAAVAHELSRLRNRFGRAVYLNLHSMPSNSAPYLPAALPFSERRADIVISDRNGETADKKIRNALVDAFRDEGFGVAVNDVYHGGELIARHAHPHQGIHAIQIEISRALYLDEESYERNENFEPFRQVLQKCLTVF